MKLMVPILLTLGTIACIAGLVRTNYIVIDGHVVWWQVQPIVTRGVIGNDREYRAVLYYVEQMFQAGGFDRPDERALADKLNVLLAKYHSRPTNK